MSSIKKLQEAAYSFRKKNKALHAKFSSLISDMSRLIAKSGATEVTVGYKEGKYYESTDK